MSETMSDSTLRKVRALMAKTVAAGCTEEEAASASAKVAEVLANYNMQMTDLEAAAPEGATVAKRSKTMNSRSAFYDFHVELMAAIAKANFCKHWIDIVPGPAHGNKNKIVNYKRHILLGREVNVISANLLYDYLIEATASNMPKEILEAGGGNSRAAHSFRMGCCQRLTQRVAKQHDQVMAESVRAKAEQAAATKHPSGAGGNALALVDVFGSEDDLNNDAFWEYPAGTTARHRAEALAKAAAREAAVEAAYQRIIEQRKTMPVVRAPLPPERTPEQKAQEAKDNARWQREYAKQCEAEARREEREEQRARRERQRALDRIDRNAYSIGSRTGESISLNKQVDEDKRKAIK